jgi:hypothetical protein
MVMKSWKIFLCYAFNSNVIYILRKISPLFVLSSLIFWHQIHFSHLVFNWNQTRLWKKPADECNCFRKLTTWKCLISYIWKMILIIGVVFQIGEANQLHPKDEFHEGHNETSITSWSSFLPYGHFKRPEDL